MIYPSNNFPWRKTWFCMPWVGYCPPLTVWLLIIFHGEETLIWNNENSACRCVQRKILGWYVTLIRAKIVMVLRRSNNLCDTKGMICKFQWLTVHIWRLAFTICALRLRIKTSNPIFVNLLKHGRTSLVCQNRMSPKTALTPIGIYNRCDLLHYSWTYAPIWLSCCAKMIVLGNHLWSNAAATIRTIVQLAVDLFKYIHRQFVGMIASLIFE